MIRKTFALLFALTLAAATPFAQADVSGSWDLTINGPQGVVNAGAVMKQAGEKVTGTLTSPQGDVAMTGTFSGKTLTMKFAIDTPNGSLDITMTGEVSGGDIKGTLDFGAGTADFTGKKK